MDAEPARKDGIPIADGDENTGHVVAYVYIECVRQHTQPVFNIETCWPCETMPRKEEKCFLFIFTREESSRLHKTTIYLLGWGKTINNDKRTHTHSLRDSLQY